MNKNFSKIKLLDKIRSLELEKKNILKRAKSTDFFDVISTKSNQEQYKKSKTNDSIKKYRMQAEYGEKKFIKPWRTSSKSQQQPPKSGKKAGGRGVQRV